MLERTRVVMALLLAGVLGLANILSAYRATRSGVAVGEGLKLSRAANPGIFAR
jgi:hypothetical protein